MNKFLVIALANVLMSSSLLMGWREIASYYGWHNVPEDLSQIMPGHEISWKKDNTFELKEKVIIYQIEEGSLCELHTHVFYEVIITEKIDNQTYLSEFTGNNHILARTLGKIIKQPETTTEKLSDIINKEQK